MLAAAEPVQGGGGLDVGRFPLRSSAGCRSQYVRRVGSPIRRVKIIAIANQKGGVGKTTTAVNLSAGLAEKGLRLLLVDLDPQANATSSLGMQEVEGESIYDSLLGGTSLAEKVLPTRIENLSLVPADLDLAGAEVEIARMSDHLTRLAGALSVFRADETFDFILLDCPPSLGILMTNALAAADEIFTPIQCEYFALEGLVKIVRVVQQVRDSGANDHLEIGGILMTMFDRRTKLSAEVVAEVRQHFGERVYKTVIPRTVRLSEAPSFGKSILEYNPSGRGAHAYRALAQEFLKRHDSPAIAADSAQRSESEIP
jgi:chromosome partitioning protein